MAVKARKAARTLFLAAFLFNNGRVAKSQIAKYVLRLTGCPCSIARADFNGLADKYI